jgi:hypothetical protein
MAIARPLDDREREAFGERELLTPSELPYRHGAMQQGDSGSVANLTSK